MKLPEIIIALLLLLLSLCPCEAQAQGRTTVWAVDFVKTKEGQFDDYMKFNEAYWARARAEMKRQNTVVSYKVLTLSPESAGEWNVLLMTEYADMKMYGAREESYRAAVAKIRQAGQGATPADGKRPRQMADIVLSKLFTAPISGDLK